MIVTKARFEMTPAERAQATRNDIARVANAPKSRAYYEYMRQLRDEGPLPEGVRENGYKDLDYFGGYPDRRMPPNAAELDAWVASQI